MVIPDEFVTCDARVINPKYSYDILNAKEVSIIKEISILMTSHFGLWVTHHFKKIDMDSLYE
jgi:hypothetical protein